MNPNDQPREFEQPTDPTPGGDFTSPSLSEKQNSPSNADFSSNPEPVPVNPVQPPSEPQPFGQPTTADQGFAPQPAFPSPQVPPVGQPPVVQGENPGQTLGIISIVLSIIGFSLIGIILGVISRKKSKEANAPTTLGTIGMVLGIVFTVVGLIVSAFLLFSILIGVQSIASESKDTSGSSSLYDSETPDLASQASTVAEKAEAYKTKAGDYPEYSSDFDKYPESSIDPDMTLYTMLVTNQDVTYLYCEPGAAQVVYYTDDTGTKMDITALGTASSTEPCVEIN